MLGEDAKIISVQIWTSVYKSSSTYRLFPFISRVVVVLALAVGNVTATE